MINFLHTFQPTSILISVGIVQIHWYGFFVVLGIIAGLLITIKIAKQNNINKNLILDLAFWLIVGGIIGGRIYDVFLELPYYANHPTNIIKIWNGGLAIHGAIFVGIIISILYARKYKLSFLQLAATITPGLALGQAIGRWGNYFNQELFGLPSGLPWGIPIDAFHRPIDYMNFQYFHPTFLYESIGDFLIFIILILFYFFTFKKVIKINNPDTFNFILLTLYFSLYSLLRFFLEFIRIDYAPTFLNLRWPQIISLIIIFISFISFVFLKNKKEA